MNPLYPTCWFAPDRRSEASEAIARAVKALEDLAQVADLANDPVVNRRAARLARKTDRLLARLPGVTA